MLDLKVDREAVPPKDAATVVIVRDASALEVFCVERSKQSRFMGGAVVFPGGKVDPSDAAEEWTALVTAPQAADRNARIAACRETLEEAALLHATAPIADADLLALRAQLASDPTALRAFLEARGLKLDLQAFHLFARWVTPAAEARRYDTLFYVAIAPPGQTGAHDDYETTASFWATPSDVLRRWAVGEVQLAPPTHRTLSLLATCARTADVIALAKTTSKDPICPRLVQAGETMALVLPGDPEHDVRESRVAGTSRYVLRDRRWHPEDAPR